MMDIDIHSYMEAGFKIFGIHGVNDGICGCGSPECKALYKHPVISNWQCVPDWSDEQLEIFTAMGHFKTGFGALCSGWLIIDVDARNGGVESYQKLVEKIPEVAGCGFVVETGSGGGSKHLYFKTPDGIPFIQKHPDFIGIDFKSSGYVIGSGSLHISGKRYETVIGSPYDISDAPKGLIDMLTKPDKYRVKSSSGEVDIDEGDIKTLIGYINPSCPYDKWIKVGMAIHHCLSGGGFEIWDDWSSGGDTYPGSQQLDRHWVSFGKSASPAGYGTLVHYAREGGYCEPVTFVYEGSPGGIDVDDPVDLKRPPGFVGELTQWINDQCLYPRENLAVATALVAVSSLAGMRYIDELNDMATNMVAFCVAGSGTGKESILQSYLNILRVAGVQGAVHGGFKSEQEVYRNLIRHQAAFYAIDELGLVLKKIEMAAKRGGSPYLEGIIGAVMSVYSKSNGYLPVTGDLKEEIKEMLLKELSRVERSIDDLPQDSSSDSQRLRMIKDSERIRKALSTVDDGIDSPFLNILGFTTPVTFNDLVGYESSTNGFFARAMIFHDLETNPRRKEGFRKKPMSDSMVSAIRNLYSPGAFDMDSSGARVEYRGERTPIPTEPDAIELMQHASNYFHDLAETHKSATGMEAIPRRGYELTSKVSLILSMAEGVRTAEHVRFAYALSKRDVDVKIQLAYGTDNKTESNGLAAKVMSLITKDHGESEGVICNRLRGTPKEQVRELLSKMLDKGIIKVVESIHPGNGKTYKKYFLP